MPVTSGLAKRPSRKKSSRRDPQSATSAPASGAFNFASAMSRTNDGRQRRGRPKVRMQGTSDAETAASIDAA
jgi:hypothetical protein